MARRRKSNPVQRFISRLSGAFGSLRGKPASGAQKPQEPASGAQGTVRRRAKRRQAAAIGGADIAVIAAVLFALGLFVWTVNANDGRLTVYLEDKGCTTQYRAWPSSVNAFLETAGIAVTEGDTVHSGGESELADGMTIHITRAYPVAVNSGGRCEVLRLSSGTVGGALERAGVAYKAGDDISELTFKDVEPGMKITHTAVDVSYAMSYKTLDYDEVVIKDDGKYESFKEIEVEGKDGKKQVTQRITMKDGVEVSREVVDQVVVEEAVDEVVRVGTKIRYQTSYTGETRRWKEAPSDGVNGWKSMKVDKITAYCTGTRTATGTKPALGTIAVNPYYFPYGTQLYIKGYGFGVARDTGAFRNYKNDNGDPMNQLDLWFNVKSEALKWGSKRNVTIWYKK